MRKYMKYEIKGTYKFILGIIAIVLIASTIIQFNIFKTTKILDNPTSLSGDITGFRALMLVISILVIFGAFLTAFFQIIGSFRKELYEDRGYLTFTLPLTGNQVLGAKLIVASLWFIALGASIVLYNLLLAILLYGVDWLDFVKKIYDMINSGFLSIGIISVLSAILTLILIYFSMALSRVSIKNKKVGGLWFVIFIILNALASYTVMKISTAVPYFLSLDNFKILHYYEIGVMSSFNDAMGSIMLFGNNNDAYINIVGNLSQIIISVLAFISTGYLIEKKIDL